MPHGFKQYRHYYISKAGHDSNSGLDPNAPKKSPYQWGGGNATHLIGAGDYAVAGAMGTTPGTMGEFYSDGLVTIQAATLVDINIPSISFFGSFRLINLQVAAVVNGDRYCQGCFLKGCNFGGGATSSNRVRRAVASVLHSTQFGSFGIGGVYLESCTLVNGSNAIISNTNNSFFLNNYVDFSSVVTYGRLDGALSYCNIQGLVGLPTSSGYKYYAIKDQLAGTPQANGYPAGVNWLTEAQLTADGYTGTVAGWDYSITATCMNRDPGFVDAANENYALLPTSIMLGRSNNGFTQIGGKVVETEIKNTDHGTGNIFVAAGAGINTSDPNGYILSAVEGYVDYVFPTFGQKLAQIVVNLPLNYNTDFTAPIAQNTNVPDADPLTAAYALKTTTTANTGSTTTIQVPQGLINAGTMIRVNGQHRTVLSKVNSAPNDVLTLDAALLAAVASGIVVSYGTSDQLAVLNPNRLTYYLRTRTSSVPPNFPLVDSDWDNEIDVGYGKQGAFFLQDTHLQPALLINRGVVYGRGNNLASIFLPAYELSPEWANVRVYLRDNYTANGL